MRFWQSKRDPKLFGWIDRTPRSGIVLELSRYSAARLARENNERIIAEWQRYLLK
jgi:hypothetical protein